VFIKHYVKADSAELLLKAAIGRRAREGSAGDPPSGMPVMYAAENTAPLLSMSPPTRRASRPTAQAGRQCYPP